jgi:hypothetical protein
MAQIVIAAGSADNLNEDLQILASEEAENPQITVAHDKDAKAVVTEKVSSLFLAPNSVVVLIDLQSEVLERLANHIAALQERIPVILYYTGEVPHPFPFKGKILRMEKERTKRLGDRALKLLRKHDKVMTDKAFALLSERLKDESSLDSEVMKLINFAGERKRIELKDIRLLTSESHDESFLDLFQALADEDMKKAAKTFEGLVLQGTPLLWIHAFLLRQARLLLQSKDMEGLLGNRADYPLFQKAFTKWKGGLSSKSPEKKNYLLYQKPFYAFKLTQTSRKMPASALTALFHRLAAFDKQVKSGTKFELQNLELALFKG